MSKIIRNGIEYGGTATTANQVIYSPTETVADKLDSIPTYTKYTASVTTGSSTYSSFYYVDYTITQTGELISLFVVGSQSNVFAYAQAISPSIIRVYTNIANTSVQFVYILKS